MDEREPRGKLNVSEERLEEIKAKLAAGEEVNLTEEEEASILPPDYPDLGDLPIAFDDKGVEELDPDMLARAYEEAARKRAAQIKAMMRASGRGSMYTKKSFSKTKRNARKKLEKKSRKKNRKK